MAKVDIKDTYYSVPILESHQKHLKFIFNGKLYQFTCLTNGLCSGVRKFTKLLKPTLSILRQKVCSISGYILMILSQWQGRCKTVLKMCMNVLNYFPNLVLSSILTSLLLCLHKQIEC